ncbi:MAG: succinate--CoA ligase subunit beta [Deltaproteobacteria bacterium]|nr:succinate--CoA ligase subunit beta [Deltaproteobacteria bacterium]
MRLLEFQAKRLLAEIGIPVPRGVLVTSLKDTQKVAFPTILKAQVPVGGRGEHADDAASAVSQLLAATVKGYPVQALLAEEPVEVQRELYLALLVDKQRNSPLLMGFDSGGIDIEESAQKAPERLDKQYLDPVAGIQNSAARSLTKTLGLKDTKALTTFVSKIWEIFKEYDATFIEINPLAVTPKGLVALDAKVVLDDNAAYRHSDLFSELKAEQQKLDRRVKSKAEEMAAARHINYVPLGGDIGVIADGAGTGMLTLDMIHDAGGKPANFCEMGGMANAEIMHATLEVVLSNTQLRVLLISLIGGLTRMDEMAEGIVRYLDQNERTVPIVVRMCGTMAEVGLPMLRKAGVDTYEDLDAAVQAAVARQQQL